MITRRTATNGLVSTGLLCSADANAQVAPMEVHGSSSDAQAFRQFAETTHPRGLVLAADESWRAYWDAFAPDADRYNFPTFVTATLGGLARFKDGHTTIAVGGLTWGGFELRLPLGGRAFYDGLYVTSAKDDALPLLGAKITHVGRVDTRELLTRMNAIWPANNPAWTHHDAGIALLPAILCGLDVIDTPDSPMAIEAITPSGRTVHVRLRGSTTGATGRTQLTRVHLRQETMAAEFGSGNYVKQTESALYVSFDNLQLQAEEGAAFTRAIFEAMESETAHRLVIDLRRNGGGDNFLGEALRRGVERSRFNRPGGLYVMIGPQTFSAAQNLANRLERETFAIFVGEPTGGAPNHYGDAREYTGPATDLAIHVSTLPWFDSLPQDHRQWIFPDLSSPARFADFVAGRDPALDLALTHGDDAEANELTRERVFYFGRPSQSGEWKPFWLA